MVGWRPEMKGGHICKTEAGNLHFRVEVTVGMPGWFFKMKDIVWYKIFQLCGEHAVVIPCFKVTKKDRIIKRIAFSPLLAYGTWLFWTLSLHVIGTKFSLDQFNSTYQTELFTSLCIWLILEFVSTSSLSVMKWCSGIFLVSDIRGPRIAIRVGWMCPKVFSSCLQN